jgi:alkylation response protein AidB-like acyl-CoA dehydrogenase
MRSGEGISALSVSAAEIRRRAEQLIDEHNPAEDDQFTFRGAQFDKGLAWVHCPEGQGGLGAERRSQSVVAEVFRDATVRYNDMALNPIGIAMAVPTLRAFGSDEMLRRHLRPTFTEEIWCQMSSEPSHGSEVPRYPHIRRPEAVGPGDRARARRRPGRERGVVTRA